MLVLAGLLWTFFLLGLVGLLAVYWKVRMYSAECLGVNYQKFSISSCFREYRGILLRKKGGYKTFSRFFETAEMLNFFKQNPNNLNAEQFARQWQIYLDFMEKNHKIYPESQRLIFQHIASQLYDLILRVAAANTQQNKFKYARAAASSSWRTILGISDHADFPTIKKAYRRLAQKLHPDKGGDAAAFIKVQHAYNCAKQEFGVT